ncbi:MAG: hypothetical protein Q8914_14960 [Bacteroidota bacterium]|nr:hypothetical protein [Bacteroidota bacterium]
MRKGMTKKDDIEEPVKKSWRVTAFLLLLLVFLIVSCLLLIEWYTDGTRQMKPEASLPRFIVSLVAIITLIVTTLILLVNMSRNGKKQSGRKSKVFRPVRPVTRKRPSSRSRRR